MQQPHYLLNIWIQENNELVNKWKQHERVGDSVSLDQNQSHLRLCSSEFHKLLRKIQGIPPLEDHAQLELTVVYNVCLFSAAQSQFTEAELLLRKVTKRVLQSIDAPVSDPLVFWRTVVKSDRNTSLNSSVQNLLHMQWAIWLATRKLKVIKEFQGEMLSLFETLSTGVGDHRSNDEKGRYSEIPLLVMDPKQLAESLQICTLIAQGAEKLNEGQSSEALSDLQTASSLPAPRTLVAYTHLLSGSCLAHMSCPQMALQCYRNALETDARCLCALYKSILIYRHLGNTQAEIQALRLLHSTLMLPSATESFPASTPLLSPSILLCSQSLNNLLFVPSALSVLLSLAKKCVLHGRVSEGVEYYLDLLAALHSEQHKVHSEVHSLPRLPELYLEGGAALLMAQRPADCISLCDEVISASLELLPEKLVLEEPEEKCDVETWAKGAESENQMGMLRWAAAAFLLQGHCHTHLKDWKQAVTSYTRCINLLVKVCFKRRGFQPQILSADMFDEQVSGLCVLQRMKGLSLAGRGISFTQTDHLREALRDLQLSIQTIPECQTSGLWCGEVLWKLGRKREAVSCWENTWSFTPQSLAGSLPLYLEEPDSGPLLEATELRTRIKELCPTLSS